MEDLNDKYFKIKECLSRCGNVVTDVNSKEEVINILFYFMNSRMYLNECNWQNDTIKWEQKMFWIWENG